MAIDNDEVQAFERVLRENYILEKEGVSREAAYQVWAEARDFERQAILALRPDNNRVYAMNAGVKPEESWSEALDEWERRIIARTS